MADGMIPVGAQVRTPSVQDALAPVSSMLQIGRQSIELQKEAQANQERINTMQFMQNPDNWQTDGRIDLDKLNAAIPKIAPQTGGDVLQKMATLHGAETLAMSARQKLTQDQRQILTGPLGILGRAGVTDPNQYIGALRQVVSENPDNKDLAKAASAIAVPFSLTQAGPHVPKMAVGASQQFLSAGEQQSALSPKASLTDTGNRLEETVSTPAVGGNSPSIAMTGRGAPVGLAPSTPTFNPGTNTPGYLGPQGDNSLLAGVIQQESGGNQGAVSPKGAIGAGQLMPATANGLGVNPADKLENVAGAASYLGQLRKKYGNDSVALAAYNWGPGNVDKWLKEGANPDKLPAETRNYISNVMAHAGKQPIQSGPALGQNAALSGSIDTVNKDWSDTVGKANDASKNIGVLQAIKEYAPGAMTGVEADRRSYLSGLSGLLGISAGELAKTNTDLLAKNEKMLALAGGDTNLARTMAEGANPNTHMTPQAINKAADQIIAQQQIMLAKQKFLLPYQTVATQTGNPQLYQEALAKFNASADPRILQLKDMSPKERSEMKAAMTPSQQKEFGQKIRMMEQLGILQ